VSSRSELRQQQELIGSLQPALHVPQNWNYEVDGPLYKAYMHPPHDVGGQFDVPVQYEEKEEEQWELNTYSYWVNKHLLLFSQLIHMIHNFRMTCTM